MTMTISRPQKCQSFLRDTISLVAAKLGFEGWIVWKPLACSMRRYHHYLIKEKGSPYALQRRMLWQHWVMLVLDLLPPAKPLFHAYVAGLTRLPIIVNYTDNYKNTAFPSGYPNGNNFSWRFWVQGRGRNWIWNNNGQLRHSLPQFMYVCMYVQYIHKYSTSLQHLPYSVQPAGHTSNQPCYSK